MPQFASKDEEITYWKERSDELDKELEEFREQSHMLEKELEASLEQADRTIRDLRIRNNRLQLENDTLRSKLEETTRDLTAQITELQEESKQYRDREEHYLKFIRELEQKNDDLERLQRATHVSLGEFEAKMNSAIERNVLLELELDEKENLKAMVQRLKDETRDLKQEILIKEKINSSDKSEKSSAVRRGNSFRLATTDGLIDSNKLTASTEEMPSSKLSQQNSTIKSYAASPGITTPTKISAMNIVGDLLRKVGALESKLASCNRNSPRPSLTTSSDSRDSFRGRNLSRGTSTPSIHRLVQS
ncbi:unnamed protein product [Bemisia tabaci]|uniref:NUDE domain-containing protein n=1 Tax=Bemisia tabaci TaxID=7038 RepID=A0A9P0A7L7_BEMTA|nr:unnamed protein product [Bemisia tabaci]